MMQVQKGQVKYKDRSDIICTYGIDDSGKQYYFLDGEKLSNGSLIASTALVEAIDPLAMASNIGVISCEGEVVIPFENKAIKPIADTALLVEKATPTTQSVIDSVNMRKDPLSATKLVTTPATIKDRMNAKMGNGGRFVFNDQFSEASVFDLDGNNLLDGEYYSFIGLNDDTLYMSKNTVDSEIVECKLGKKEENNPSQGELLDVKEVVVKPEVIDKAMQPVVPPQVETENGVPSTDSKADNIDNGDNSEDATNVLHPVTFQEIEFDDKFKSNEDKEVNVVDDTKKTFLPKKEEKETRVSLFEGLKFDEEPAPDTNKFSVSSDDNDDRIIEDTAVTLSKLIAKNKEQKVKISSYEAKLDDLIAFKRQAFNENKKLVKEIEMLKKQVADLETELVDKTNKVEKLTAQIAGKDDLVKLLVDAKDLLDE